MLVHQRPRRKTLLVLRSLFGDKYTWLMDEQTPIPAVPRGFEEAHAEWVRSDGPGMRRRYMMGFCPEFYRSTYWKLVRAAVLKRDGFACCRCGEPANQVHHLDYRARGEDHFHPEFLVSVCRDCHGLVEYARLAESKLRTFRYRIGCIQGYINGKPGSASETPLKSLSRLLEYRAELDEYEAKFQQAVAYDGGKQVEDCDAWKRDYGERMAGFQRQAREILVSWTGTDVEKSQRVLGLVEAEMQRCIDFAARVLSTLTVRRQATGY